MRSQVCQLNMGMRMETSLVGTPFLLTTNINTEYKQINSLSIFCIIFEDTITVFKQLVCSITRTLSCCFLLTAAATETQKRALLATPLLRTEVHQHPYHWVTQWNMVSSAAYQTVKYKTGKVLFWITTVKQVKRIKLKPVNRLWITSLLLKETYICVKHFQKL